jgi:uncharacterized membrane protein YphA (DoxX/SURF4 family)
MTVNNPAVAARTGSTVAYWIVTILLATECIVGGIMGALRMEPFIAVATHLGYPAYFMTIIGVWYVCAGIALLLPHFPRLKEWAYAGLVFNYTGAAASHFAVGDNAGSLVAPIVFTCLAIASWALRPAERLITSLHRRAAHYAPEMRTRTNEGFGFICRGRGSWTDRTNGGG